MKHIGELRRMVGDLYSLQRMAVTAITERDKTTLINKLTEMKRKIAAIEARLENDA